jgi:hypothetical protein
MTAAVEEVEGRYVKSKRRQQREEEEHKAPPGGSLDSCEGNHGPDQLIVLRLLWLYLFLLGGLCLSRLRAARLMAGLSCSLALIRSGTHWKMKPAAGWRMQTQKRKQKQEQEQEQEQGQKQAEMEVEAIRRDRRGSSRSRELLSGDSRLSSLCFDWVGQMRRRFEES